MSRAWAGGSTRAWRRTRRAVLVRDEYRCQVPTSTGKCGAYANQAGHVVARVDGGTDDLRNLRAECAQHNQADGARLANRRRRQPTSRPDGWSW